MYARCVSQLLKQGYDFEFSDDAALTGETQQSGTILFVKRGPAVPIENTEKFQRAPKDVQDRLRGIQIEGDILDQVAVPFVAKLRFGQPQTKGKRP